MLSLLLNFFQVLFAIGRDPDTKGLGLEKAGVKINELLVLLNC